MQSTNAILPAATANAIQMLQNKKVDVFIGPEHKCRTVARLAAAADLPIVSHMCLDSEVVARDKTQLISKFVAGIPEE